MTKLPITGGCLCGAVRYTSTAEPIVTRQCWCRVCQYLGAGSSTVNVCFLSNAVTVAGKLADYVSNADSGNILHRRFFPVCGTPVSSVAVSRPHLIFIRVGTLEDPSIVAPDMNIWTKSAPVWAHYDEALPNNPAQPPPAA